MYTGLNYNLQVKVCDTSLPDSRALAQFHHQPISNSGHNWPVKACPPPPPPPLREASRVTLSLC